MKTELIENIQANLTNNKKVFPIARVKYFETPQTDRFDQRLHTGTELVVKVELGAAQFISDELLASVESEAVYKEEAKRQISRSITKHVYGDIQSKLLDIIDEMRHDGHYNGRYFDGSLDPIGQLYTVIEMMDYS